MRKGPPGRLITFEESRSQARDPAAPSRELLLSTLEEITRVAADADSVAAGLTRALAILCNALRWPIGHIYQRAEASSATLTSTTIWHLEEPGQFTTFRELSDGTIFQCGQGLVGQVLAQQRPGLSPDVTRDRRFLRRRAARTDDIHAWLAFPIIVEGQVIAVCELLTTERVILDISLASLLTSAGIALGRLYERDQLRRCTVRSTANTGAAAQTPLSDLAAAIAHEINSPLFSARMSLALIAGGPDDEALIAGARADLARIAATMETLQVLARSASLGHRLAAFVEPPAA